MNQAPLIEGLRGYLALWVVFDHILGISGYSLNSLSGIFRVIRSGWYAVDIFVIISGFVIFYLLDNKSEKYSKFIIRRFFRLWPLFITLFIISIPLSIIYSSNVVAFLSIYQNANIGDGLIIERIDSWWENIFSHIIFHITMLHGIVPNLFLPNLPSAFLSPAWSISLEWQFYLIAPIIFNFLKKYRFGLMIISVFLIILFLIGKGITSIQFGAFLPMHIEYFFIGALSYYFYKLVCEFKLKISFLPIGLILAAFLFFNMNLNISFLPYVFWLIFFSLVLDFLNPNKPVYIIFLGGIFDNKIVKYLGKISYSIYLSHFLVIIIQYLILKVVPLISQKEHLLLLLIFTTIFSHFLYKYIELPGIIKGKLIIEKIKLNKNI